MYSTGEILAIFVATLTILLFIRPIEMVIGELRREKTAHTEEK